MKRFLKKSTLLAALVLGLMLAVFLLPLPYNHDLSAIVNKRDLLINGRRDRIIFVGGSGLYSALDSNMIQQKLGRPVVNMGLWAGFAITPVLREIRPYLHPGDTVVIVSEYGRSYDRYLDISRKWLFALAPSRNLPALYGNVPHDIKTFAADFIGLVRSKIEALPIAAREAVRTRSIGVFISRGYVDYARLFNANGDSFRIFPEATSPDMIRERGSDLFSLPEYRDQSLEGLNAFCRHSADRGISTFFVFPAYPDEEYRRFRAGLKAYERRLRAELACPILGSPEDFLYPYSLFTDTIHHLGLAGRRLRTERMIALLEIVPGMRRAGTAP
jgi:hypothetical protein